MDHKVLNKVLSKARNKDGVALVTITKSSGATPRKAGAIMGIWKDGIIGSIGGGKLENKVIEIAREAIVHGESRDFKFTLNNTGELGMTCGGQVEGFIKIFSSKPQIIIVGAGHIGQKLMNLCKVMELNYLILDDRTELLNKEENSIIGVMDEELKKLDINTNSYIVIATRNHDTDRDCLEAVINSDAKYIGMVGSKEKISKIIMYLRDIGIEENSFEKLFAPIGLKISDGGVEEIALEILAEIIKIKNSGVLEHRRINY